MKHTNIFIVIAALCLAGGVAPTASAADIAPDTDRLFVPQNPDAPERRREGGLVSELDEANGGVNRGVARGVNRGVARGVNRGVARGVDRGVARGVDRGVARGVDRGVARGVDRGVARSGSTAEQVATADLFPPDLLAPLAPKQTGLSADAQPRLQWYLSHSWAGPLHFTINRPKARDPEFEVTLQPPAEVGEFLPGMHEIDLADYGVALEQGIDYEWFVFIVRDPVERSADLMASATVRYVPSATTHRDYTEYARAGYWYDAIADLNTRIGEQPESRALWGQRARMMDEVGMPVVAQFDRE